MSDMLQFPSWDPSSTRNELRELVEPKPVSACWIGSVSLDDEAKFTEFMSSARSGDIQSLANNDHIGGDLAYAVLLKLADDRWKLVVIISQNDLWADEQVLFSATIRPEVQIEIYGSDRKIGS